ncbi:hypothetical protein Hanom_Chr15g01370441 [Helianthus anomalus]
MRWQVYIGEEEMSRSMWSVGAGIVHRFIHLWAYPTLVLLRDMMAQRLFLFVHLSM